jgi:hypothetical protein
MSGGLRWRCTWHWSPPGVRPGPREPSSKLHATEAQARAQVAELREMAAAIGATVVARIEQVLGA